jgi:hypothetical protein
MTITNLLMLHPWMEAFRKDIKTTCPDCGVKLGEQHKRGCDVAQCTVCHRQSLICHCVTLKADKWLGLMYLEAHKIALETNLWCRCLVNIAGDWVPCTENHHFNLILMHGFDAQWHVPCERSDPGATADLNRASIALSQAL